MSAIAALGNRERVEGFALAGVRVLVAEDDDAVRTAWSALDRDVAVLILTQDAQAALSDDLPSRPALVWTTLPG
jgi:vacuolar-type H+-ATPase subunit F/Vma7